MNTRRAIIFIFFLIVLGVVVGLGLNSFWQRKQPLFENAPKLIAAVQAYSRDRIAQKLPLPPAISLQQLVDAGYISASDIQAFDGMQVTISLGPDKINSKQVLMRVRLVDGTETALMQDGSIETPPKKD